MKKLACLTLVTAFILCTSGWNGARSQAVNSGIALTYANDKMTDGAGSQLIRIYGIYALSRYFHVPYVHTPLKEIGYQGLAALEKNGGSSHMQDRYNRIFTIPSDIQVPANSIPLFLDVPKAADILRLKNQAETENKFYLLRILLPVAILNTDTEMLRCLKTVSPFKPTPSHVFRLAIHVRRGEEFAVDSQRMLPNSSYITAAMRIVDALKRFGMPFVCELYTEVASKTFVVTTQSYGMNGRLSHPVVINPKMNRIEDFDVIPNLHKFINTDPIEALKGMSTADALIISKSEFSYLPALFGQGIVVYYPMEGAPLKEWLIADKNGDFSSEKLGIQLHAWKHAHENARQP